MGLFGGKKQGAFPGVLGVDLGPSGVKVVELMQERGRMRLSTYGYSEFAEPSPEPFAFLENPDEAVDAIRRVMKESGMRATRAIAALPSGSVFQAIVTIPIPKDDKEDLKRLIEMQAAKFLPMPLSEMILDSNVLDKDLLPKREVKSEKGKEKSGDEKGGAVPKETPQQDEKRRHVRVLMTGAPKTLVEKYVDLFRRAKLELVSLETEVFGLIRSLVGKDKSRIMLVDMGFAQTNIAIVDKGVPYLARSMKGGGAAVTQALAASMGMGFAEAERMKRDLGIQDGATRDDEPPKAVKDALENFVHELRYALELYAQQDFHQNTTVEKIVLTGGSAHLPALDPYMTGQLNVNVYVGDPWARVAAPPSLRPVLEEVGPRFAVAIGLAMRMNES